MASQATDFIKDITAGLQKQIDAFAPTIQAVDVG